MNSKRIRRTTLTAFFIALVVILGLTPLGLIPLGFINITILSIPVITGTLLMGLPTGILLGFAFGTVSMMSMLGMSMTPPSLLAGTLFAASPVLAILMCYVPRLLVPVAAHVLYRSLHPRKIAPVIAAALASLTNTVMYLGAMWFFYTVTNLDTSRVVAIILGTGMLAGGMEALAAALLVPPIIFAVRKTKLLPEGEEK